MSEKIKLNKNEVVEIKYCNVETEIDSMCELEYYEWITPVDENYYISREELENCGGYVP